MAMTTSIRVKIQISILCLLMIAPPWLLTQALAQTLGGGGVPLSGFPGASPPLPGQPIITNPTALQPITPAQVPCPPATEPTLVADLGAASLNDFWPTDLSSLLPSSVEQRIRQERQEREERERRLQARQAREEEREGMAPGPGTATPTQPGAATQPGAVTQLGATGAAAAQRTDLTTRAVEAAIPSEAQGLARLAVPTTPAAPTLTKDYSIQEAFSRFSILQGINARLKQFGYDFFDVQATGFAPVLDVPVGPDYTIGPQDSLAITIWNVPDPTFNRSFIVTVERDGTIVIPQVGAIPVGGLTFSQTNQAISNRLRSLLKRFEVHVSMARLRTIKVAVVGEVVRPGAYEVSSLATVSNALYAACGPAKSGSLRQVRVVREGKPLAILDFYDFLLAGDRTQDRRLQAGDVVVVPPLGPVAAISGAVKRSAIYEIAPGLRLTNLLQLAGGLTAVANRHRGHIFRIDPGRGRMMLDVDLTAALRGKAAGADPLLQDGDYVRVSALTTKVANVVSLAGAVTSPGPYEYRAGMRLRDLLTPEQMTVDAYPERAELIRTDPETYQTRVIEFSPRLLFAGNTDENLPLQRWDQVTVASRARPPRLVSVEGEVKRPGSFTIEAGERLNSVLKRAGGFTDNAFPQGIVLIRESVKRKQQAELDRFIATERERLAAQSAATAAGRTSIAGGAALTSFGQITEQQILALRVQQLEAVASRLELGRVVVRLDSLEQLEGTEDDLPMEARDRIVIPQPPQTVSIIGSVKNPVNVVYRAGLGIEDYLRQAGGPAEQADRKEIYVVRANGTTDSAYLKIKEMQPGDTIVVPQKVEAKFPKLALWQSVAGIVGSAALAVAGIAVVGRR